MKSILMFMFILEKQNKKIKTKNFLCRKGVLEEKRWKKLLLFAIIENIEGNILIDVL